MKRPWGIQAISDAYGPGVQAGLPDGRWVIAVAEPYWTNPIERMRAAWWVLTGRAVAFVWPKAGDLESALGWDTPQRQRAGSGSLVGSVARGDGLRPGPSAFPSNK